jgi:hypothetical protein
MPDQKEDRHKPSSLSTPRIPNGNKQCKGNVRATTSKPATPSQGPTRREQEAIVPNITLLKLKAFVINFYVLKKYIYEISGLFQPEISLSRGSDVMN